MFTGVFQELAAGIGSYVPPSCRPALVPQPELPGRLYWGQAAAVLSGLVQCE